MTAIVSPKQSRKAILVPNRDVLQRRVAEEFSGSEDGAVIIAPPVFMLSEWVEDTALRIRQLEGRAAPATEGTLDGLLAWSRAVEKRHGQPGRAFSWNAARLARQADRLLRQWQEEDEATWVERDFFAMRAQVREDMDRRSVVTAQDWMAELASRLSDDRALPLSLPAEIHLEGFIEFTPLEERLFGALETRGVSIQRERAVEPGPAPEVVVCDTPEDEWRAAACWARQALDAGARSVCIVVPPGTVQGGPDSRALRTALVDFHDPLGRPGRGDVHIPDGQRLSECRAAQDAMLLLRLGLDGMDTAQDFARISQWLLSPYWHCPQAERLARARLEWRLREHGHFRLSPADVARYAKTECQGEPLKGLDACVSAQQACAPEVSAGARLHAILRAWGWPGPDFSADLAPEVKLQAGKLHSVLEHIASLDPDSPGQALELVEINCADTRLPLSGGPLSPVQVLSPEVAAAGCFDGVWICQVDDSHWPPPIAPNPYLPAPARAAIPRMNPEGQHAYYRRMTDMLARTAPAAVFSWSRDGGEGERSASALVGDWPARDLADTPWHETKTAFETASLEWVEEPAGQAFGGDETVAIPGGAGFFRLQAACPLAAYARYRLQARFPEMPSALPDAAFRGVLLHRALSALYATGGDPRGMPSQKAVAPAVQSVLADSRVRARLTPTGLRAEQERLERALCSWLDLDGRREGFRVEALEEDHEIALGRAQVRTRFDRRDRLEDGRFFLIDYKSSAGGASRALKWLRPRMQEVQLPLYAVLFEVSGHGEAGGMAFATVRRGDCAFDGISDDDSSAIKGIRLAGQAREPVKSWPWPQAMAHWREQARMLADEILAGRADNRVYDAQVLKFSGLELILRHEQPEADEEAGADDG